MTTVEVLVDGAVGVRVVGQVDGLLALAEYCSMSPSVARGRIARVTASLNGWRDQARANRIAEREIAMMAESIGPRLDAVAVAGR